MAETHLRAKYKKPIGKQVFRVLVVAPQVILGRSTTASALS
jgi:hypothetical protein